MCTNTFYSHCTSSKKERTKAQTLIQRSLVYTKQTVAQNTKRKSRKTKNEIASENKGGC